VNTASGCLPGGGGGNWGDTQVAGWTGRGGGLYTPCMLTSQPTTDPIDNIIYMKCLRIALLWIS
jgi:hypothetical protein